MKKTKKITLAAVFTALTVILKTFTTVFLFRTSKFGFSFVPAVLGSAVLGPLWGGAVGGLSDVLGYFLVRDGAYYPGFTVSAVLKGVIYGLFLFKKPKNIPNILLAILTSVIVVDLGVNTLWIHRLYGTDLTAVFLSKIASVPVFAVIQAAVMYLLFKYLRKEISRISE
ncbi:MAG: folate family ECF transporter S component [Clostridiales bacterium]|nr:folate family ECF transporter S component [Clostridiales bacterium]